MSDDIYDGLSSDELVRLDRGTLISDAQAIAIHQADVVALREAWEEIQAYVISADDMEDEEAAQILAPMSAFLAAVLGERWEGEGA